MRSCFLALVSVLAVAGQVVAAPAAKSSRPDIFLITIDTLRADHVGCYGNTQARTPALDSLAKDGVRFSQAFTPSPITNSSHASILTGLLPSKHGVTDFAVPLSGARETWAEALKAEGYKTAAFIGAVILDSKTLAPGFDRGFDFYDNFPAHSQNKSRWGRVERRGMDVVGHAKQWLGAHPVGPRFVWVHLYDPHDPYEAPEPYGQEYRNAPYDGEIAYADSVVADFISYLKLRGWYDGSLVAVVGDHGEGLGEHGEETHGIFLYDSTTHVPLLLKLPQRSHAGETVAAQVRTTDLFPTVLDWLRISPPEGLDGESLQPYFAGAKKEGRPALGETDYPLRFGWAPLRSLRAEGFKYIAAPRPEFYDLAADPKELKNIYDAKSEQIQQFQKRLVGVHSEEQPAAGSADQAAQSHFRALGYAGTVGAAAAGSASLPDPKDKIEQQNLLHRAMMASDDERPGDARAALEKVLKLDAKSLVALRQLGELELHAEGYGKAAGYLQRAREIQPDDASVAYYLGQALEKTGDLPGARDALEASLKSSPGQFPARLLLGQVYLGLQQTAAAEDQFEAASLLQPESVEPQIGIAKAKLAIKDFSGAVQQLEPLATSKAKNSEVFTILAEAYAKSGRRQEAQRAEARAELLRKQELEMKH